MEMLDHACRLKPDVATYLVRKAELLQCQLRLKEAAEIFRAALRRAPEDPHAKANLVLWAPPETAFFKSKTRTKTNKITPFLHGIAVFGGALM